MSRTIATYALSLLFLCTLGLTGCDDDDNPSGRSSDTPVAGEERNYELGTTGVSVTMVWVVPGTFTMGNPDSGDMSPEFEHPSHEVTLTKGFWLGKYELTQEQWSAVMGSWFYLSRGDSTRLPADNILHFHNIADTFLPAINDSVGETAWRLPTEAEWEYAARAGSTTQFYWGDDTLGAEIGDYAWYEGNSGASTNAVGQKLPNAFGLYDMAGNVYEWCSDWASDYTSDPATDPRGPDSGTYHITRGGGYRDLPQPCRSAYRNGPFDTHGGDMGLRLARSGE